MKPKPPSSAAAPYPSARLTELSCLTAPGSTHSMLRLYSLALFVSALALVAQAPPRPLTQAIQTPEFRGSLYLPTGTSKGTAILLIGGSEGRLELAEEIAPQLAATGYPVLAVDYHDGYRPGRKLDLVPIETFTHAVAWLRASTLHPAQIAVLGDSRGSEAALLTGIYDPTVDAVLALVPSSVLWGATDNDAARHNSAWSWHGQALSCANCMGSDNFGTTLDKLAPNDPAHIPAEQIQGAIFLAASDEDAVWPSARMARDLATRLAQSHFAYPVTLLTFPHSSHQLLGTGPSDPNPTYEYGGKSYRMNFGGTAEGTLQARTQTWAAIQSFLATLSTQNATRSAQPPAAPRSPHP